MFNTKRLQELSDKLRRFSSELDKEEENLLSAMLRLGGQAIGSQRPAQITNPDSSGDLGKAFQDAFSAGPAAELTRSKASEGITVDLPPVTVGITAPPVVVSKPIDPPPVTVTVGDNDRK